MNKNTRRQFIKSSVAVGALAAVSTIERVEATMPSPPTRFESPNELRNYVHLRNLLDAFEKRVLKYCSSHENPEGRFNRVKEIRDVLTNGQIPSIASIKREEAPMPSTPTISGNPSESRLSVGFGPNELRNYVFLRSLLDAFEKRVLKYCFSHENPEVRFNRIKEISDTLACKRQIPFLARVASTYPNCDPDERCDGTACVPVEIVDPGWPENTDPPSWKD